MDSIDQLWDRIETWLAANAPEIVRALPPGVTDDEIRQVEATMEGPLLPEDVKASYRWHNGYSGGSFLMHQVFFFQRAGLYLGQARLEDLYGEALERTPAHLSGPIQPVWRHPAWLNLTANGAGDYWC
jgi:cell wall assembly regulator SMI1